MFDLILFGGEFYYPSYKKVKSLKSILSIIQEGFLKLNKIKKTDILELFQKYSENLRKSHDVNSLEGVMFLSNWLRKSNFSKIIERDLGDLKFLEKFIGERKRTKAQPRGIVCHWIAGNVPTLGLFSLFQSLFVGNANILRIPPASHEILVKLLQVFADSKNDSGLTGLDLLKSVGIVYYEGSDDNSNYEMAEIADIRIIWGGEAAVRAITGFTTRSHCIDIIFGPKYSFSVFDLNAIKSENFSRYIRFLVNDIIVFDQAACTSPHTVFFERGVKSIQEIGLIMAEEFQKISKQFPKTEVNQYITTKIINIRAEYALDPLKSVICPRENDWTILINDKIQLEEPIESRTIFIKEVDSIIEVIPLITRKIQTIGCAVEDKKKLLGFADQVTLKGVSRCVNLGQMHLFDSPWDGMLLLSRLVNWVTLYYGK